MKHILCPLAALLLAGSGAAVAEPRHDLQTAAASSAPLAQHEEAETATFTLEMTVLMIGEVRAAIATAGGEPALASDDLDYILSRYQEMAERRAAAYAETAEAQLADLSDPEQRASLSTAAAVAVSLFKWLPVSMLSDAVQTEEIIQAEIASGEGEGTGAIALFDAARSFGVDPNRLRARVLAGGDADALATALAPKAEILIAQVETFSASDPDELPVADLARLSERIRATPAEVAAQAQRPAPARGGALEILITSEGDRLLGLVQIAKGEMDQAAQGPEPERSGRVDAVVARRQPDVDVSLQALKALADRWVAIADEEEERARRAEVRAEINGVGDLSSLATSVKQHASAD